MKILDNLHQVDGVNAGAYLLIGADGLSLVDVGFKGTDQKILAYMQALGHQPTDLKRIFLTHADTAHIGALRVLAAMFAMRGTSQKFCSSAMRWSTVTGWALLCPSLPGTARNNARHGRTG